MATSLVNGSVSFKRGLQYGGDALLKFLLQLYLYFVTVVPLPEPSRWPTAAPCRPAR